jgi:hypothetical protein
MAWDEPNRPNGYLRDPKRRDTRDRAVDELVDQCDELRKLLREALEGPVPEDWEDRAWKAVRT